MPAPIPIQPGDLFGELVVIEEAERRRKPSGGLVRMMRCRCSCGVVLVAELGNLRSGHTTRCQGCGHRTPDRIRASRDNAGRRRGGRVNYAGGAGPTDSPGEHRSWRAMLGRCLDQFHPAYRHYGARGITVCDRWLPDVAGARAFANFLADLGPRPHGTSLDRIDNEKGYSPENCAWRTPKEQRANQRPRRRP